MIIYNSLPLSPSYHTHWSHDTISIVIRFQSSPPDLGDTHNSHGPVRERERETKDRQLPRPPKRSPSVLTGWREDILRPRPFKID